MAFDAGPQNLIDRLCPPVVGENLDFGVTGKALRLDRAAHRSDIDHAVAHHAAVVENVSGRHQPVADVKRQQAIFSSADNLRQQLGIPPDVIDVERDAQRAGAPRIQPVANIQRLFCGVDASAVGGIGRMQRLDRQRHLRSARVVHQLGEDIFHLRPCCRDIPGRRTARPRILRQSAGHQHDAGRAERLCLIDGAAVVVAHFDAMRGIRREHPAAAIAR